MADLSPITEEILHAVTLGRYDVPYQACPASIDRIKSDVAAVLWALANHKQKPWNGSGPMDHWDPSPRTRRELMNIIEELKSDG